MAPVSIPSLPPRISGIGANQIAEIADLARDDPKVIKLWIGEGDLPTPDFIQDAADRAMRAGHTRYTYSLGIPALRAALGAYHKRHWNLDLGPDRFTITAGGVAAIMQGFQAILEPGDEVIIPVPTWPNVMEIVRILGGRVVPVPYRTGDGGFRLDLADVAAKIGPRTKAIAINSPSNPTGWVMPVDDMVALRDLVRARGLWLVADEVYAQFTPDGRLVPSFLQITEPTDKLLVANTFSKNWCMTGWRIGWLIYPQGLAPVFDNLSQYNTTSVPTFIQHAAVTALEQGDDFIRMLTRRSAESGRVLCDALAKAPRVTLFRPQGTFYCFFSVHGMNDAQAMAVRILREAGVGLAPGSAFGPGGEAYLRLCFAVSPELVAEGAERLVGFFERWAG